MTSISCLYIHYNRTPINFVFVKYENFIKIMLNDKSVVMTIKDMISYRELFQIYIMSLILTEDTSTIEKSRFEGKNIYGVSTIKYWKNLYLSYYYDFIPLEKSSHRNPLNTIEPKRSTSSRKINKFMRTFYRNYNKGLIAEFDKLFQEYYSFESSYLFEYFNIYIEYEKKIQILSAIKHNYGNDIYSVISNYM